MTTKVRPALASRLGFQSRGAETLLEGRNAVDLQEKRTEVKALSKTVRQYLISLAVTGFVIGVATSAFAVPPDQVLRNNQEVFFNDQCCFSFNESVEVIEPAKPVPAVLTWTVDYDAFGYVGAGLMVNDGQCQNYGAGSVAGTFGEGGSRTFQWVVYPSDGLHAGTNTFTLCGGGVFEPVEFVINVFEWSANTLAVRLSN
jgi:hypothetical protein